MPGSGQNPGLRPKKSSVFEVIPLTTEKALIRCRSCRKSCRHITAPQKSDLQYAIHRLEVDSATGGVQAICSQCEPKEKMASGGPAGDDDRAGDVGTRS